MEILLVIVAVQAVNTVVFVWSRRSLLTSNLVLRQQLTVFKRKRPRPALRDRDRLFWSLISRVWKDWRSALVIVKPDTVVRWQKKRFRDYWRRKSRPGPGRPPIEQQHIEFIRRISGDHPEYGEDKIALELELKFGIQHSEATIRKYMVKAQGPRRSSQSWSTFLKNQGDAIWTCDFCVQYTVRFTALYIFVIMELGSRRIVHINVTAHPNRAWVRQQIRDAHDPQLLLWRRMSIGRTSPSVSSHAVPIPLASSPPVSAARILVSCLASSSVLCAVLQSKLCGRLAICQPTKLLFVPRRRWLDVVVGGGPS